MTISTMIGNDGRNYTVSTTLDEELPMEKRIDQVTNHLKSVKMTVEMIFAGTFPDVNKEE